MELWNSRSVHAFKAKLMKPPEPSEQEMDATLAAIKLIPYTLKKPLSEAAKKLPSPPGGRPHLMTPEQCQEACAQIGSLLGQGVEPSDALQRLASNYKVALRTMQRVWQNRGKPRIQVET
ncbi:hypothetical protein MYX77_09130 [Acidobacteriia bacterium AH_259_A11_L15]|nr:hypothetical protein [Acidobacteriia bacterium AH_259_A11_L15]